MVASWWLLYIHRGLEMSRNVERDDFAERTSVGAVVDDSMPIGFWPL